VNLRKKRKRQLRKVGREEEGSSSNRPELMFIYIYTYIYDSFIYDMVF